MIKKYKFLLIIILLFSSKTHAFSPEIDQEIYVGCYSNSKQYMGPEKAKNYCLCTLKKLNEKYNDDQINKVSNKDQKKLLKPQNLHLFFVKKHLN